jgi:precorrin-6A/cobalt-precorrin-6A reductase
MTQRVLILGGTGDAAALASRCGGVDGLTVISSLAGRTRAPAPLPGEVRVGGFGGVEGLVDYLDHQSIDAVIDATHPFADIMSHHAAAACRLRPTPWLMLVRPPWQAAPGDRWIEVATMNAAAAALPPGARAFLTVGRQELAPFAYRRDVWFLVRLIDPPDEPPMPGPHAIVMARGPFDTAAEQVLMVEHKITSVVTKNSGGNANAAKLAAARTLNLPVVMVQRPLLPAGDRVESVDAALGWLHDVLRSGRSTWACAGS